MGAVAVHPCCPSGRRERAGGGGSLRLYVEGIASTINEVKVA
jgi:hypothetical protein